MKSADRLFAPEPVTWDAGAGRDDPGTAYNTSRAQACAAPRLAYCQSGARPQTFPGPENSWMLITWEKEDRARPSPGSVRGGSPSLGAVPPPPPVFL